MAKSSAARKKGARHQADEQAHNEAHYDDFHGGFIAVYFCQAVVYDIRDREDQNGSGELQRQGTDLPGTGYEKVGCYEAYAENDCEPHVSG